MKCFICHRLENYDGRAGLGRIIHDCDRCERPVCSDCAESDYDSVGDPPHYVRCQWTCPICLNPAAHIGNDEADYEAATILQAMAEHAPTAFGTAVLNNAARHLAEREVSSRIAA